MWRFYLDISIDLMVMGRVDALLLGLFKGVNEKSDGDSSGFDPFCSLLLLLVKDEDCRTRHKEETLSYFQRSIHYSI